MTEQLSKKRARSDEQVDQEDDIADLSNTIEVVKSDQSTLAQRRKCPYLDTVNRQLLDFDMEKLCSVTLTNMNVYSCLVCGSFFQGRGQNTPGL